MEEWRGHVSGTRPHTAERVAPPPSLSHPHGSHQSVKTDDWYGKLLAGWLANEWPGQWASERALLLLPLIPPPQNPRVGHVSLRRRPLGFQSAPSPLGLAAPRAPRHTGSRRPLSALRLRRPAAVADARPGSSSPRRLQLRVGAGLVRVWGFGCRRRAPLPSAGNAPEGASWLDSLPAPPQQGKRLALLPTLLCMPRAPLDSVRFPRFVWRSRAMLLVYGFPLPVFPLCPHAHFFGGGGCEGWVKWWDALGCARACASDFGGIEHSEVEMLGFFFTSKVCSFWRNSTFCGLREHLVLYLGIGWILGWFFGCLVDGVQLQHKRKWCQCLTVCLFRARQSCMTGCF